MSALNALAQRTLLAAASRWRVGTLHVRLPDGQERVFGTTGTEPSARIDVHDAAFFHHLLLRGELGFGEAFVAGEWSSPALVGMLCAAAANRGALAVTDAWWRPVAQMWDRRRHRTRRNTLERSRENIEAHYDLGNDLYRLFLDPTMTYSSGVFTSSTATLQEAQIEKYRRIAALAGIQPGANVLEIGGGWGGFAMYAAETLGCRVTTTTLSPAQQSLARERICSRGLQDRIDVQLVDYRRVVGRYDAVVSIEMLEAVGSEYYEAFFEACDRALRPGGRIGLQVITVPDRAYERKRRGVNWIQRYIFPGGLLPSLAAIERALARTELRLTSVDDIASSYVRTLRLWRERFLAEADRVRALGFDERFVRTWTYYLAISEAGFAEGVTQDLQIGMVKAGG